MKEFEGWWLQRMRLKVTKRNLPQFESGCAPLRKGCI
jgi:hypothetical protein